MESTEGSEPTAHERVTNQYEEIGMRRSMSRTYAAAVVALRDREIAALLRAAGHADAAALIEPDPAVIDEAFGPE